MARTLKRLRARAARGAAASTTSVRTVSADAIDEELWAKCEDALLGLLEVEVNDHVMDAEHFCPKSVELVVRLDLVRALGAHDKVENRMRRAMDALGLLCVMEEVYQATPEIFWKRLVASEMMTEAWDVTSCESQSLLRGIITFSPRHGLRVILCWKTRVFQSCAAHAISTFLQSPRRKYEELFRFTTSDDILRLIGVGLRLTLCQVSPRDLLLLMEALAVPKVTCESELLDAPLCGAYALMSLEFRDVKLDAACLDAIAAGLSSPHTRCINSLSLEKVIQLTNSPDYNPAFKRLLEGVFQAKHTDMIGSWTGLELSLADNLFIQPVHIEALQDALAVATRPLCRLNLTNTPGGEVGVWLRLGQIFFVPSRIKHTEECELIIHNEVGLRDFADTLATSLGNIVGELLPRVGTALRDSIEVICRVYDTSLDLSTHETYRVMGVRISGQIRSGSLLVCTPSGSEISTWVDSSSINYLRIGEDDLVDSLFTHLSISSSPSDQGRTTAQFIEMSGSRLRSLVLRDYRDIVEYLPRILRACPGLQAVDLDGVHIYYQRDETTTWDWTAQHDLEIINVRNCDASAKMITSLLSRILQAPHKALRLLDLRGNRVDEEALDVLLQLLQVNRSLVRVDLYTYLPPGSTLQRQLKSIDAYLQAECLTPTMERAFLSVLRLQDHVNLDTHIVRNVFEFTGTREKRMLLWNKREPVDHC